MLIKVNAAHTLHKRSSEDKKAQFQPGKKATAVANNHKKMRRTVAISGKIIPNLAYNMKNCANLDERM